MQIETYRTTLNINDIIKNWAGTWKVTGIKYDYTEYAYTYEITGGTAGATVVIYQSEIKDFEFIGK